MSDTSSSRNSEAASTRRDGPRLRVPTLPSEAEIIRRNADAASLSVAAYLRAVGMGYEVKSRLDHQKIDELAKVNGDLGRLGGLLKLWLTNDEKLAGHDEAQLRATVKLALDKIVENQDGLRTIITNILDE